MKSRSGGKSGQMTLPLSAPAEVKSEKPKGAKAPISSAGTDSIAVEETAGPSEPSDGKGSRSNGVSGAGRHASTRGKVTAETMAKQQREISVSEFFAKNRHLLGFDNKRKALLTTVKEAVDNSLDACEEAGILPDITIKVEQLSDERFKVTVRDNGPGIVKQQIPNVFGKLLYGSKFHRLKMSRGQQGIGISAAGMYGLITTGQPISVISRTASGKEAHHYKIAIDTKKNRPDIVHDDTVAVDWPHGTEVEIELLASYNKGRQSVDEYVVQTAIANPHTTFRYTAPGAQPVVYERGTQQLPPPTREIKPHPHGVELGTLMKMLKETESQKLGAFLQHDFSRISPSASKAICEGAGLTPLTWIKQLTPQNIEAIYRVMQETKLMAPSTDCLAPIGGEAILNGLLRGIKAEFYTATTRSPTVYRGNPFQIEVGMAYGGELGADKHDEPPPVEEEETGKRGSKRRAVVAETPSSTQTRILRFANRVPLLYQQSACSTYKAVVETKWNNYGLSQSRGALPDAPLVILIHIASVWVPYTSESKEAIADYDEIRKEIKLALAECGRKLAILLRRKKRKAEYGRRRDVFTRYIDEVVESVRSIARVDKDAFRKSLLDLAKSYTAHADLQFDEHGQVIKAEEDDDGQLPDTIVVERTDSLPAAQERQSEMFAKQEGKKAKAKK